jgi:uncharacterized surface protein with fasciclin (FAS1) repeats
VGNERELQPQDLETTMILSTALLSSALLLGASDDSCSAKLTAAESQSDKNIVETAVAAGSFETLAAALEAGDLVAALQGDGPFTVFAPTDDAFAKLPKAQLASLLEPENKGLLQAILTYHVVPGKLEAKDVLKRASAGTLNGQRIDFAATDAGVMVDGAKVVKTDIQCSNGVIHVIDSVILPSTMDIVETAVEAGAFETLATALKAAGLVEALQGDGPFTVFAPTDEAFAKLPAGTVESLVKPENRDKLTSILKLHVVSGRFYADAVAEGRELASLQGQHLKTKSTDGRVLVNGATVVKADVETANGVIHVIDSVLLPEG